MGRLGRRGTSELAKWHNEWHPKHWGDAPPRVREFIYEWYDEEMGFLKKAEDEAGRYADASQQILDVIRQIDDVVLEPVALDNQEQQKLLAEQKTKAKQLLYRLLDQVKNYRAAIRRLEEIKITSREKAGAHPRDIQAEIRSADNARTHAHDALIVDIQSTVRFLSHTFGQISEEAREEWEDAQEERGKPVLRVKRIFLPPNVLLPANFHLRDRVDITAWAFAIYHDLEELKKAL